MRVRAKHWLNHGGIWHQGGDEFEVSAAEAEQMKDMVTIVDASYRVPEPEAKAEEKTETPKKRGGRPRKTAE